MESCSACGVTKQDNLFITRMAELGLAKSMTSEAFYSKCCVYAKRPGCINKVKSTATPNDFDNHCKTLGSDTESFMGMAKELRERLINEAA
ncbi:MAG: hypothetical protein KME47_09970 [Nodosilinea sp. WJT8-NPBG4]|jgi:hypothetical protein|nr:hypothetical protein [Nodosilinea sp. WJT8-NPBG4]